MSFVRALLIQLDISKPVPVPPPKLFHPENIEIISNTHLFDNSVGCVCVCVHFRLAKRSFYTLCGLRYYHEYVALLSIRRNVIFSIALVLLSYTRDKR